MRRKMRYYYSVPEDEKEKTEKQPVAIPLRAAALADLEKETEKPVPPAVPEKPPMTPVPSVVKPVPPTVPPSSPKPIPPVVLPIPIPQPPAPSLQPIPPVPLPSIPPPPPLAKALPVVPAPKPPASVVPPISIIKESLQEAPSEPHVVFDPKNPLSRAGIVLPQKNAGPSILSASRASAADVLAAADIALAKSSSVENAGGPKIPEPIQKPIEVQTGIQKPPVPVRTATMPNTIETGKPKTSSSTLHTYQSDIENRIKSSNVSLVSIAAAQARNRDGGDAATLLSSKKHIDLSGIAHKAQIVGGFLLMVAAIGVLVFTFFNRLKPQTTPSISPIATSFIYVDATQTISIPPNTLPLQIGEGLEQFRETVSLPLGLIGRLYLTEATSTSNADIVPLNTEELFLAVAPSAPQELVRALNPEFLLGIHSFDGNQPFIIFKTDAYEQAFAGMLAWEPSIESDIGAFFKRNLVVLPSQITATTTDAATISTTTTDISSPLAGSFIDRVVENHDARVVQDADGNILLLWTFLDRNTLVITTNEYTLREIISRLAQAPTVPVPGN